MAVRTVWLGGSLASELRSAAASAGGAAAGGAEMRLLDRREFDDSVGVLFRR
jgi:hypothetical protein